MCVLEASEVEGMSVSDLHPLLLKQREWCVCGNIVYPGNGHVSLAVLPVLRVSGWTWVQILPSLFTSHSLSYTWCLAS